MKKLFLFMVILSILGLTACSGRNNETVATGTVTEKEEIGEEMAVQSENTNINGRIPETLELIPDEYRQPAEHKGTLNRLTYDTWESFSYEDHSQKLTKDAWVYLPYNVKSIMSSVVINNANELNLVIDGPDEKQLADEVGKLFALKNPEL